MEIVEIRRERLKKWFEKSALPEAEKSYLSQLINGKASFGEKAARRLEKTYGMPVMYLDEQIDESAPDPWGGLSELRRELIKRIASQDVSDDLVEALGRVVNASEPHKQPPKRPASAVSAGPPKIKHLAKKARTGSKEN